MGCIILQLASELQRQATLARHSLTQYDAVQATCDALFDDIGCLNLFEMVDRGYLAGRQPTTFIDKTKDLQNTAFVVAISSGWNASQLSGWVGERNLTYRSSYCGRALVTAAISGDVSTFEYLLKDVTLDKDRQSYMVSSLSVAVTHNREAIARSIIKPEHGFRINRALCIISPGLEARRFSTVMMIVRTAAAAASYILPLAKAEICAYAAHHGNISLLQETCSLPGPLDINMILRQDYHTSIMLTTAAKYGQLAMFEFLLDKGASIVVGEHDALIVAAEFGRMEILRVLLRREFPEKLRGRIVKAGQAAERGGHREVAEFLRRWKG